MSTRSDLIAKAIFDWLNGPEDDGHQGQTPYTYNPDAEALEIGVDGNLDCKKLAEVIDAAIPKDSQS